MDAANASGVDWDCRLPAAATGTTGTGLGGASSAVEEVSAPDGILPTNVGIEAEASVFTMVSDCVSIIDVFSSRSRANFNSSGISHFDCFVTLL
uniref:Pre-mRNA-processing protein 40A-like n=1 Tax=Rhizophora mucronata TaxID=61149 RepID=A0A2P2KEV9_RHIMU